MLVVFRAGGGGQDRAGLGSAAWSVVDPRAAESFRQRCSQPTFGDRGLSPATGAVPGMPRSVSPERRVGGEWEFEPDAFAVAVVVVDAPQGGDRLDEQEAPAVVEVHIGISCRVILRREVLADAEQQRAGAVPVVQEVQRSVVL